MKEKIYPSRLVSGLNEKEWLFTLAVVVLGVPSARAFRLIINPAVKYTAFSKHVGDGNADNTLSPTFTLIPSSIPCRLLLPQTHQVEEHQNGFIVRFRNDQRAEIAFGVEMLGVRIGIDSKKAATRF